MNDLAHIVRSLCEHGEEVRVSCDRDGWIVEHGGRVALRDTDGRRVLVFLGGVASRHVP